MLRRISPAPPPTRSRRALKSKPTRPSASASLARRPLSPPTRSCSGATTGSTRRWTGRQSGGSPPRVPLSPEEVERYARHIVLHGIGGPGQQKLKAARVLVVGAGGLGSPLIQYLAAAGIGEVGIVDDDA